jgi:hypothetical protein
MERAADSFVVWVDGAAPAGAFAGRVEHVQTADRAHFGSEQELLAFLLAHRRIPDARGGAEGA